eukprot:TRINITY_DN9499_c0_g1_i2.p1 TRINITY_DN9499_c0_g1~~TRINITY_DN9499_c0_g1_i2.p1  ORF type:complete len:619 (-),score=98.98 TRINITY_DN9499_c0_g1_i2:198-2054(-)
MCIRDRVSTQSTGYNRATMQHPLRCSALVLIVMLQAHTTRAIDQTCGGLGSGSCYSCTKNNVGKQVECSWCVNRLQCLPPNSPGCNQVNIQYKCPYEDATPTLYSGSVDSGPTDGNFSLKLQGINFGLDAEQGHEAGDTRKVRTVRVGPFNCTEGFQSNITIEAPSPGSQYKYQAVTCSRIPGIGFNLTTCLETRGSELCTPCGVHQEKRANKTTCPPWLPDSKVLNPLFSYLKPNLTDATAPCLEKDHGTCMIRAGMLVTLTGVHLAPSQAIVDVFDTKVITPDGTQVRWDPQGMKGTEVKLGGFPCQLPYHVINETTVVCAIGYGTGKGLSLGLEVGGVKMNGNQFDYFQYSPPLLTAVSPSSGPSYGEKEVTITGRGFGVDVSNISVTWTAEDRTTMQLAPLWVNDSMIRLIAPRSNSNSALRWNVSVIAGGQVANTSLRFMSESCATSCNGIDKASDTCNPPGMCQCNGVFNFQANTSSCLCDTTNPCVHGSADCNSNVCVCTEEWTKSAAPAPFLLQVCDVCELSCSTLDKEVTGGDSCHCTFNTLHLIWMIGVPLLLCFLAICLCCRHRAQQEEEEQKFDVEATEPLAGSVGDDAVEFHEVAEDEQLAEDDQ